MTKHLILKLVTGEEIIGTTESDLNDSIVNLEDPASITYSYNEKYEVISHFIPFINVSKEKLFTFSDKHIILKCIPTNKTILDYESFISPDLSDEELEMHPSRNKRKAIH